MTHDGAYVKLTDVLRIVKDQRYPVVDPTDPEMTSYNNALWDVQRKIEALNNADYVKVLEAAIDAAWYRYKEHGSRYAEGFADGLEAAMRIWERLQYQKENR